MIIRGSGNTYVDIEDAIIERALWGRVCGYGGCNHRGLIQGIGPTRLEVCRADTMKAVR